MGDCSNTSETFIERVYSPPTTASFDFRATLIKIQDVLSDGDRQRLNFLLGDDVPKVLREDSTTGGAIRILDCLFEKTIITNQDCDYLIEAFMTINCHDAAKRLKGLFFSHQHSQYYSISHGSFTDYQRNQANKNKRIGSVQDILLQDYEEDKIGHKGLLQQQIFCAQEKIIFPTSQTFDELSELTRGADLSHRIPNSFTECNTTTDPLLPVNNKSQTDANQSRCLSWVSKRSLNTWQWIVIIFVILTILSIPLVLIMFKKRIEQSSKLKEGKISVADTYIPLLSARMILSFAS